MALQRWVILRICRNGTGDILSDEEHTARPARAHAREESGGNLQNRPLWNPVENTGEGDQQAVLATIETSVLQPVFSWKEKRYKEGSMPLSSRALPCIGIALVLAVLLSAHALVPTRAFAQSRSTSATSTTSGPVHFVWTVTRLNNSRNCTFIHNQLTDDQPQDLLFVTPYWANDPHPIYVSFSSGGLWLICHADQSLMPLGARFNVLVAPRANSAVFITRTSASDFANGESTINSPLSNGNPSAQIFITQNLAPNGIASQANSDTANLAVRYDSPKGEWAIFNEDASPVPLGAALNVMIGADGSGGGSAFYLPATSSNTSQDTVAFNNPLTNNDGNALLFVTPNWNPGGALNNNAIGVSYGCIIGVWCIYNQQVTKNIPIGAAFNILAFPN